MVWKWFHLEYIFRGGLQSLEIREWGHCILISPAWVLMHAHCKDCMIYQFIVQFVSGCCHPNTLGRNYRNDLFLLKNIFTSSFDARDFIFLFTAFKCCLVWWLYPISPCSTSPWKMVFCSKVLILWHRSWRFVWSFAVGWNLKSPH